MDWAGVSHPGPGSRESTDYPNRLASALAAH